VEEKPPLPVFLELAVQDFPTFGQARRFSNEFWESTWLVSATALERGQRGINVSERCTGTRAYRPLKKTPYVAEVTVVLDDPGDVMFLGKILRTAGAGPTS